MKVDRSVFICSPFAPKSDDPKEADKERVANIKRAQDACRYALECGLTPYAPHLYFTQFLDDKDRLEREVGQLLGHEWLLECDELWVIGKEISKGMKREIEVAEKAGIPIRHYVGKRTPRERIMDAISYPDVDFREMD